MTERCRPFVALTLLLVAATGCGPARPSRVPVSGQIVVDGEPLTTNGNATAFVQFVPTGTRAASGEIDTDGRFELTTFGDEGGGDGCVPGTHTVAITVYEQLSPTARRWLIPKQYSNRKTSGLSVTVNEATKTLVIDLTWNGGQPFVERLAGAREVDPALTD